MCMTMLWIINVGIDATFEHLMIEAGLGGGIAGRSCQVNVQECRNVA